MQPRYISDPAQHLTVGSGAGSTFSQPLPIVSLMPTQPVYQRALNNSQAIQNPLPAIAMLVVPIAMGVAWSRNDERGVVARAGLSLLAGMFSWPYLAYVGYDMYIKSGK